MYVKYIQYQNFPTLVFQERDHKLPDVASRGLWKISICILLITLELKFASSSSIAVRYHISETLQDSNDLNRGITLLYAYPLKHLLFYNIRFKHPLYTLFA
jgi:hypothetical protein